MLSKYADTSYIPTDGAVPGLVHMCCEWQVLAATQTPTDKEWFQGTADAVRQYTWLFEDIKNRVVQDIIILSGDHLCGPRRQHACEDCRATTACFWG